MKERQKNLGIKGLSPEEVAKDSSSILKWLKGTGASKVVVHFDMDVIDPADMIAGVGVEPNGMKIDEVVRAINNIASKYDLGRSYGSRADASYSHQAKEYAGPVTLIEIIKKT